MAQNYEAKKPPQGSLHMKVAKITKISKFAYQLFNDLTPKMHTKYRQFWAEWLCWDITDSDWEQSFHRTCELTQSTKLQAFQYRLINCALITNKQLYKWNIRSSYLCTFCIKETKTILPPNDHLQSSENQKFGSHCADGLIIFVT